MSRNSGEDFELEKRVDILAKIRENGGNNPDAQDDDAQLIRLYLRLDSQKREIIRKRLDELLDNSNDN